MFQQSSESTTTATIDVQAEIFSASKCYDPQGNLLSDQGNDQ